jgi:hypothetical protein
LSGVAKGLNPGPMLTNPVEFEFEFEFEDSRSKFGAEEE